MKKILSTTLFLVVSAFKVADCSPSLADPIYVFRERDGSIRFTNRKPPVGVEAKVFSVSQPSFSVYRVGRALRMSPWIFKRAQRYEAFIDRVAQQFAIDANLVKAVVHAESGFNPTAVSPKGAQGLMQLMPGTAQRVGVRNPFVAEENLKGGVKYLAMLVRKYDNIKHALAAYNAGEGVVDQYGGIPPYSETQTYVSRVLELRERYRQGADRS